MRLRKSEPKSERVRHMIDNGINSIFARLGLLRNLPAARAAQQSANEVICRYFLSLASFLDDWLPESAAFMRHSFIQVPFSTDHVSDSPTFMSERRARLDLARQGRNTLISCDNSKERQPSPMHTCTFL